MITRSQIANEFLRQMKSHVGERETAGPNRSPFIDEINRRAGAALGSPYCLAGATCALDDACKALGLKNPVGIHAGTQNWYDSVPEEYKSEKGYARLGDIGIFQDRGDRAHGHAFFVAEDEEASSLLFGTIEFNTNHQGSRDGDGVWPQERSRAGSPSLALRGFVDVCQWVLVENFIEAAA